ncbi:hypothetical protein ACFMBG_09500 [Leisingera sp. D0M16]|uniref:hypothetical protein n=1 Tax=Leisingera coralii TaxID=3351347 RepID=UPI003B781626
MQPAAPFPRRPGAPPFTAAVLHCGPGAADGGAPVAQELAARGYDVLEPWPSGASVGGQISELRLQLEAACAGPAVLISFS